MLEAPSIGLPYAEAAPRPQHAVGYNERLFSSGLRKWLHEARFRWLERELAKRSTKGAAIVELGCFDCRSLRHIPQDFGSYLGFDADWEGGLTIGRRRTTDTRVSLYRCTSTADFGPGPCDVAISLETLEHMPPPDLPGYLRKMAASVSDSGVLLVSVPNETGLIFLAKQAWKAIFFEGARSYTLAETVFQALGMVRHVQRDEHKGFSWREFVRELRRHFDIERVSGIQASFLPAFLNPSIGIVAKAKH